MDRIPLETQTLYAELLEQLTALEARAGSWVRLAKKGLTALGKTHA